MLQVVLDDEPEYDAVSYVWVAPEFVKRVYYD
jgi:hypothetical protein